MIRGHADLVWPIWSLDPQNPSQKSENHESQKSQKSKNRSKIHKKHPILANEYSKCSGGYFWSFPAYRTLKTVIANFLRPKYDFWAIFDAKTSLFKSTTWCPSDQKSWKSQNRVYTVFRAQKSSGIDSDTLENYRGTRKWCFEHFLAAAGAILMAKSAIFAYFWGFLMILHGLNFWAAWVLAARVHKNRKKSKSPKMGLKAPKLS